MAEYRELLEGDFTEDTNRKSRSWEWLPPDHFTREAKLFANLADFILEQKTQRLNKLELHMLRKPTHIVVALNQVALLGSARLNDIGVKGALCEVLSAIDGRCDLIKDLDELLANRLTLELWIRNTLEAVEETLFLIRVDKVNVQVLTKVTLDLRTFIHAEKSGIDKDTGQLCADCLVDQCGNDNGVDATGEATDDLFVADLLTDCCDGIVDEGAHGPETLGTTNVVEEVTEHIHSPRSVGNFNVNLSGVNPARMVCHTGNRRHRRLCRNFKSCWGNLNRIRMGHPTNEVFVQASIEVFAAQDIDMGLAVFRICRRDNRATIELCNKLMSVADTKNRNSGIENGHVDRRRIWFVDTVRATAENDSDRILSQNLIHRGVTGDHFAENLTLTDPAGNQLRVLPSEIQHDNKLIGWAESGGRFRHYSDDLSGQFAGDSNA